MIPPMLLQISLMNQRSAAGYRSTHAELKRIYRSLRGLFSESHSDADREIEATKIYQQEAQQSACLD
jgi:hypothetical protein